MIKVEFLADAIFRGVYFKKGRVYEITEIQYANLSQSCQLFEKKKTQGLTTASFDFKDEYVTRKGKKILVVKSYGIGNILHITPLIKALKKEWPDCHVDLLVQLPEYKEILRGWKYLDYIYTSSEVAEWDPMKKKQYDLVIDGIYRSINVKNLGLEGEYITGDHNDLLKMHEIDANMKILDKIGIKVKGKIKPEMPVKRVKGFDRGHYIGICAGFGGADHWKLKNWGYRKYAELCRLIIRKFNICSIFVLGTGNDKKVMDDLPDGMSSIIDCVGKFSIQETAYLIKKCRFIVCNDTGLGHVASAVDTRTYSIFGPTVQVKNKPYIDNMIISRNLKCMPCQLKIDKGIVCQHKRCMDIEPDEVMKMIENKEKKYKYKRNKK